MKSVLCPYIENYRAPSNLWSKKEKLDNFDGTPADNSILTFMQTAWNENFLFSKFEGKYEFLTISNELVGKNKTKRLWETNDVFEMFISHESNNIYKEFQVAPDGKFIDIAIDASSNERISDFSWLSGFTNITKVTKNSWKSIFIVPWAAFNGNPPKDGEEWTANFYRISSPLKNTKYLSWSPVYKIAFHQPNLFGKIIFQKQA